MTGDNDSAVSYDSLAKLYEIQNKYDEAGKYYRLTIEKKVKNILK